MSAALLVALAIGLLPPAASNTPPLWIGQRVVVIKHQTTDDLEAEEGDIVAYRRLENGQWGYLIDAWSWPTEVWIVPPRQVISQEAWKKYWPAWRKQPWAPDEPFEPWWNAWD